MSVEAENAADENEWKLVHVHGVTNNENDLCDEAFGVAISNAYRLIRTVEQYQWRETSSTREEHHEDGTVETITDYHYDTIWCDHRIDSTGFFDREGHDNPENEWPFVQETQTANFVMLGKFRLESRDVNRLGNH